MFAHVLVPLDGSQLAETALSYARYIVKAGGKITLVSVVDMPFPTQMAFDIPVLQSMQPHELESTRDITRRYLQGKATELAAEGYITDSVVEVGYPEESIVNVARRYGVDAIIMSTHGRTGLSRMLMGSVTYRVLNDAGCPVLVIPNKRTHSASADPKAEATHA